VKKSKTLEQHLERCIEVATADHADLVRASQADDHSGEIDCQVNYTAGRIDGLREALSAARRQKAIIVFDGE
jgi:hypothetical protein